MLEGSLPGEHHRHLGRCLVACRHDFIIPQRSAGLGNGRHPLGNGRVNASVNYVKLKDTKGAASGTAGTNNNNDSTDLKTIAIGYTYDVSNRTSFYGMVARTDYEREAMAGYMRGNGSDEDSVTGVQFGMTHKF